MLSKVIIYTDTIGGGTRNAYTVGALKTIAALLPKEEHSYDIITGTFLKITLATSLGAINAFVLGMYPPGEEQKAVNELLRFWLTLTTGKVYKNWFFGLIEGLFYRSGLYNARPLRQTIAFLARHYAGDFKRKLNILMTDLSTGELVTAEETIGPKRMLKYLEAAAVSPGFFPPVIEGNASYVAGSVLLGVDVQGAIERCREIVDDDRNIVIDVIMIQEGNSQAQS